MANPFFETPRNRRLKRDLADMKTLAEESSIFSFQAQGDAPSEYQIRFDGKGLGPNEEVVKVHKIDIQLGMEYPRTRPDIRWVTPILHPNISGGTPCFGTFIMNPNVRLVDLVEILWDMARLSTYNPYGGYGDKDRWQVLRKEKGFPIDPRILRDKVAVEEKPPGEDEGPDLIIMGRHSLGALMPSRPVTKRLLEEYFWNHAISKHVEVLTAEEWYEVTREAVPGLIVVIRMDEEFTEGLKAEPEKLMWFSNDLGAFLERLGLRPKPGPEAGLYFIFGRRA